MPAERLLGTCDLGLHLDDEERAAGGVPGENVDGATLAELRIAHLRKDGPPAGDQLLAHTADDLRMALVEQSVEIAASPSDHHERVRIERSEDPPEDAVSHAGQSTCFQLRDQLLTDARPLGDVDLAKSLPDADRTNRPANRDVVHRRIMATSACLPLTCTSGIRRPGTRRYRRIPARLVSADESSRMGRLKSLTTNGSGTRWRTGARGTVGHEAGRHWPPRNPSVDAMDTAVDLARRQAGNGTLARCAI